MNLAKFHNTKLIHRNHLHLYILTMKKQIKESIRFHRTRTKKFHNSYGNTKEPE